MITLTRGQKIDLANHSTTLQLHCEMEGAGALNFSCFALNSASQLADEHDFVFYNQPHSPDGALRLFAQGTRQSFTIELNKLPAAVHKLVFVASLDEDCATKELATCHFRVVGAQQEIARLDFGVQNFNSDKAILVAEDLSPRRLASGRARARFQWRTASRFATIRWAKHERAAEGFLV